MPLHNSNVNLASTHTFLINDIKNLQTQTDLMQSKVGVFNF
jgi:hypothetical protein